MAVKKLEWHQAAPAPLVLLSGKADALADRARDSVRAHMAHTPGSAAADALEVHDIDAVTYRSGQLLTLASPSLFGDPRLIRVDHVETANDAFFDDLRAYVDQPDPETVVVLRHRGGNRGKPVIDTIRKSAHCLEVVCDLAKPADKPRVVQAEFKRLGAQATAGAIRQLVNAYGEDLAELLNTCAQLVRDSGPRITEAEVERLTEGRVETTAFKIADAACAGRGADAIVLLRHALATGAAPIALHSGLAVRIRNMAKVKGSQGPVAGMAPWQADQARRDARAWTDEALAELVERAAETDWLLKGAGTEPEYALERLVLHIARRGRA